MRRPSMKTHTMNFERDDETTVEVEYTISDYDPGVSSGPPENCYPPEGGEVEIVGATINGELVELTDAECEKFANHIAENHDFSDDDFDDYGGYDD